MQETNSGRDRSGVACHTSEAILLCEAAEFDAMLVETAGVGRAEAAVVEMVDMFVLVLPPAAGGELQRIKHGVVVGLADLALVNKADDELAAAARRSVADYGSALRLIRPPLPEWQIPVPAVSVMLVRGTVT